MFEIVLYTRVINIRHIWNQEWIDNQPLTYIRFNPFHAMLNYLPNQQKKGFKDIGLGVHKHFYTCFLFWILTNTKWQADKQKPHWLLAFLLTNTSEMEIMHILFYRVLPNLGVQFCFRPLFLFWHPLWTWWEFVSLHFVRCKKSVCNKKLKYVSGLCSMYYT